MNLKYFPGIVTLKRNGGESLNRNQQRRLLEYLREMESWTRRCGKFFASDFFRELSYQLELESRVGVMLMIGHLDRCIEATKDEPAHAFN